jgi:hypothetical protein
LTQIHARVCPRFQTELALASAQRQASDSEMAARQARDDHADLAEQRRREVAELGRLQGKATEAEEVFP